MKKNIYIYPFAREHSQDKDPKYYNTTPLSKQGIEDYFNIVDPDKADYFYLGQISCGTYKEFDPSTFEYFKGNEDRHIVEVEGDWCKDRAPDWILKCICAGNSNRTFYNKKNFFTRPCLSTMLIHLAKKHDNVKFDFNYPDKISYGFRGQHDPYGTREKLGRIINTTDLCGEVVFNPGWAGQIDLKTNHDLVQGYARILQDNIFSLCPRGYGEDTMRIYETCFFGRIPVLVNHAKVMQEDVYPNKFFFRISPDLSEQETYNELKKLSEIPLSELHKMCDNARDYFKTVVVEYFKDPTKMFLETL